ncbi:MAG: recombinase family protein [Acidimicrobiales bacterium]
MTTKQSPALHVDHHVSLPRRSRVPDLLQDPILTPVGAAVTEPGIGCRAAIYCRVSTDEQADRGTSLTGQAARCADYATRQGWPVVARYIDDGVSGATIARPALSQLMTDAAAHRFNRVIVTDPDRLSRDLVDGLVIERHLTTTNVQVIYLIQPAMGILERQIRGVIAEEERRKTRERTSRGLRAVATAGYWTGGPPPYGYQLQTTPTRRNQLAINPHQATVLVEIIDAVIDHHHTPSEIAADLNSRNVPTPATSRRGAPTTIWTGARIRSLLLNAKAITRSWPYHTNVGTIHVTVPAIITEQRLGILYQRLNHPSFTTTRTRRHRFLFSRRITSPCGHPMYGYARPDDTGRAYMCSQRHGPEATQRCECRRASADHVDRVVWDTLAHHITNPDRLRVLTGAANTAGQYTIEQSSSPPTGPTANPRRSGRTRPNAHPAPETNLARRLESLANSLPTAITEAPPRNRSPDRGVGYG